MDYDAEVITDGVMVAGDAASMVNALHWEGTNMAITAGKPREVRVKLEPR